ncbi:glycyl radical protein [Chloroflexota bacterium]
MEKDVKHWIHGCTERVNGLRDQYLTFRPSIDIERAVSYTNSYKETESEVPVLRRAKALKKVIEEKTIVILPDELIVGTRGSQPRVAEICPEISWTWVRDELDTFSTRPQDPYAITEKQKRILREEVFPYWEGKSMEEFYLANLPQETKNIAYKTGIVFGDIKSLYGPGEFAAGYGNIILKRGFRGIRETAETTLKTLSPSNIGDFDKRKFLEAIVITCENMKLLGKRYADEARKMADIAQDSKRREELLKIAKTCDRVPYEPPETFREVMQAVWFTQMMLYTEENAPGFCLARLDQYSYPFYKKDLAEGNITELEAQELIDCLYIKMAEITWALNEDSSAYYSGYQPSHGATCGGLTRNGQDATNELSYMMVQAIMDVRLHVPSLSVRIHPQTPGKFLMKVCDLISLGTGQPAVFFDPTAILLLLNKGVSLEDAREWSAAGCVEPQVPGKMCQWDEGSRYSYANAVEYALTDGVSLVLKRRIGPSTGDPRNFNTYDEFKEAVKKQLSYMIGQACINVQLLEKAHQIRLPKPLMSCCVEGCVETGIEIGQGGAVYNSGPGLEATGIADLADSLAAVKKLVFEEKVLTMDQLMSVIKADFEGYEDIRLMLINKAPKYGNDIDEVDLIAQEFTDFSCDVADSYRGIKGSKFCSGLVPVSANVAHGVVISALPSGRKATKPLADGLSPYMGYDYNGPTAVIKSICKINHEKNGLGTLLNMKLSPILFKDEKGKRNLIALLRTEMDLGGYHVQFNVVERETLLAAQREPEQHGGLLVRVAGYSAYFVDLRKELQDAIIDRTDQTSW